MTSRILVFISGFIFALGLAISGMTQPHKVVGFLDFLGSWDPSLAVVMGGALTTSFVLNRRILARKSPIFAMGFYLPARKDIDFRLVAGASLFGAGWGLAGYCPGPAVASLGTGSWQVLTFIPAMLLGMVSFHALDKALQRKRMVPSSP